ncbi:helix-turn-helix domain-containing protein [Streptomyces sp. 4N509B]|uniref:helix-turn-helix domain-containing protein n=1 Tax=Streptomyces sp. 4N509B TaxID=3457413 RepID=UPI003FD66B19
MAQSDMPTMRSRRLGGELRRLRVEAGLKVQDAAAALECGHPKISQIETGKRGIRQLDLTLLLDLYGVGDEQLRANLKRLAKEIHRVDWWSQSGPMLHDELKDYLTLEADSRLVRSYESMVLPGLLQTEAYMRAVIAPVQPERVDALVDTRMRRKELLGQHPGFRLRTVIDVPALHRMPGSREERREQIDHLLHVARRPNVSIQVLTLDASLPVDQWPPFTIFSLGEEPPADVVWLEHLTGGTLLERRHDVALYSRTWGELTAAALAPAASRQYLRDLIKEKLT